MKPDLSNPSEFYRAPVARGSGQVVRAGGDAGAGLIERASVITAGEAHGHGQWLDAEFVESVATAINRPAGGVKVRFTHPGLSGDGMGKFLGWAKGAEVVDGRVLASIHFSESAHATPDGDLAGYVMELAEADPTAFGVSIAFRRDPKAEEAFVAKNGERSPDEGNTANLPHARMKSLRAADVVDDPAANPGGLFHRGDEIAADADALMKYATGLEGRKPELVALDLDPDRAAGFLRRWMNENGLAIRPEDEQEKAMADELNLNQEAGGAEVAAPVVAEPPNTDAAKVDGMTAERERQNALRKLAGTGGPDAVADEVLSRAIDEGWSVSRAAPVFLQNIRDARAAAVVVTTRDTGSADFAGDVATALAVSGGCPLPDGVAGERARKFVGMGFQDLARVCMQHENRPIPGHNADELFADVVGTGTFTNILDNTAGKALQRAYAEQPDTFSMWAGKREVSDFKEYKDIALSSFGSVEEVNDAGEIKVGALAESAETFQATTYGKSFSLTRKTFINDTLGAFLRVPAMLGAAARRNIADIGYTLLVSASGVGPTMDEDSKALFSTTHASGANYATGGGTALATGSLTTAKALFRKMKGRAAVAAEAPTLNLTPDILLVPAALEGVALGLTVSEMMLATTTANTPLPAQNIHRGTLKPIVEARLDAATNGATAWYLIANPAAATGAEHLVVVFLRGNEMPRIERKDPENVLGIGWRMYHDCGVAAVDFRGIQRQKGA